MPYTTEVMLHLEGEVVCTGKILIGADGASSQIRKWTGMELIAFFPLPYTHDQSGALRCWDC